MTAQTCQAVFLSVHDGDTVHMDVQTAASIVFREDHWRRGFRYRLARINAPELTTTEGITSRDALVAFCGSRPTGGWQIITAKQDPYGRYIAELVSPDGINVSDWMVAGGYAVVVAYKVEHDGQLRAVPPGTPGAQRTAFE